MTEYEKFFQWLQTIGASFYTQERHDEYSSDEMRKKASRALEVGHRTFWFTHDGRYVGMIDRDVS